MNKKIIKSFTAVAMAASLFGCSAASNSSATTAAATATPTDSLTRKTAFGDVTGTDTGKSLVWYGIPYGAAPVGELRWSAPTDPTAWSTALDCTAAKDPAMQYVTDSKTGVTSSKGTDDCLNLDVYSTANASNLPVLVYIHGGNNQSGSSKEIEGNEIVVRDNCVYVSLNYRLGLLGFNCLPALQTEDDSTGNYTMLDIAKALDWIKQNIAQFGGNPDNITVSGFSAGGRDVMAMLISPIFKDKFQKAVAFSGGMTTADEEMSADKIAELMAPLAIEDGKAADTESAKQFLLGTGSEVKDYLYSIDSTRLAAAVGNASIRMSAFPHLYTDGVVLPTEGFDTKTYNSVPLLMLTGSTEFSFFNNSDASYSKLDSSVKDAAVAFGNTYGSDMYRIFNAEMSAEKMADSYQSNIYIAQVDFGSAASKTQVANYGAFHGIFVPMLADTNGYTSVFDFANAAGYQAMATTFNEYLANFLKTGDPNGDDLPTWNNWTKSEKVSQVFDADSSAAIIENKDVSTTYKDIMDRMDADTSIDDETKKYVIENSMNGRWFSSELEKRYNKPDLWK